ncbi:uncharacterized protein LOC117108552 [Anneissia japonica]|uniref:uncharacterized protein LOC117108552 n=1 Tax=Anneissia japonica TaxID=1529436 RepID=UPI0014258465|nr:uncharacterized protein LOC117108552 [Anneissia japonica]
MVCFSVAVCDPPGEVQNGTFAPQQTFYYVGMSVNFTCQEHFGLNGFSKLTCREDGTWNRNLPECIDDLTAFRKKLGEDDELGMFPAIVASIVMASAFLMALIFFIILVIRRASEQYDYEDSIENVSQREDDLEIDEIKQIE